MIKITIEKDGEEPVVYENVTQYHMFGSGKNEFSSYNGTYPYIIGMLYYSLMTVKKQWMKENESTK